MNNWEQAKADIFKKAFFIREFESTLLQLYSEGLIAGTIHTCLGQELVGAVIAEHLREQDFVFSNHRGHGHFLARYDEPEKLLAEIMGRTTGLCGGRGGSQHIHYKRFWASGVQGSLVPVAAGTAWAQILNQAAGTLAIAFVGEGTFGQGVLYETMNIASRHQLPLLLVVENNGYAQSTKSDDTMAGTLGGRARAFEMESTIVDTWNPEEFYLTSGRLIASLRERPRPAILQVNTYRLGAHSKGDDDRPQNEIESFAKKDPINRLVAKGSSDVQAWAHNAKERMAELTDKVKRQSIASAPGLTAIENQAISWRPIETTKPERVVKRLNQSLHDLAEKYPNLHFLGEDLCDPYGGAFKITKGLSTKFPERVLNMPISEAALVGVSTGMALGGILPFTEIMFGDFLLLAADQLVNVAAKIPFLGTKESPLKMVIRTPMGGYRGYGPTHSQSLEGRFLGLSGLRVYAYNSLLDPNDYYPRVLSDSSGPVLSIENKSLYSEIFPSPILSRFEVSQSNDNATVFLARLPKQTKPDVSIITYGAMVNLALQASLEISEELDLYCQVLAPLRLWPFSLAAWADELPPQSLIIALEEGPQTAGFSAEVLAQACEGLSAKRFALRRLGAQSDFLPATLEAERSVLPSVENLKALVKRWAEEVDR
ncbi:MAG: dehydrogenase E1 component subunit alpha/beta [Bdellovibrionales bacterium]